jgi:hypothetical protein
VIPAGALTSGTQAHSSDDPEGQVKEDSSVSCPLGGRAGGGFVATGLEVAHTSHEALDTAAAAAPLVHSGVNGAVTASATASSKRWPLIGDKFAPLGAGGPASMFWDSVTPDKE